MSSSSIHADLVGRLRTLGLEQRSELRHRLAGLSVAQRALHLDDHNLARLTEHLRKTLGGAK